MSINYELKEIHSTLKVKDGVIDIAELPEKLVIKIPQEGIDKIAIQFNKAGTANFFTVKLKCSDKDCEAFSISDLNNGTLTLLFHDGELIKLGNHSINPRKVDKVSPYIKIIGPSLVAEAIQTKAPAKKKQEIIAGADELSINSALRCLLCNLELPALPCCEPPPILVANHPEQQHAQSPDTPSTNQVIDSNRSKKNPEGKKKPNDQKKSKYKKGQHYTYINTIDASSGKETWSRVYPDGTEELITLQEVRPEANSSIAVFVKGIDSVDYELILNGESFYLDKEKAFGDAAEGTKKQDSTQKPKNPDTSGIHPTQGEQVTDEAKFKSQLIALDKVLESFNAKYSNIDYRQATYSADLLQLQENIKCCFGITLGDADALKSSLQLYKELVIDSSYWDELDQMINNVTSHYKTAVTKTSHAKMFYMTRQVPDEDRMKMTVKQVKQDKKLEYNFWVKGGLKIDFSSGFFMTWIRNNEYTLQNFTFAYRESKDTVVVRGGVPQDSIMYSGNVLKTSGNFIALNENKISYMAGVFAHFYRRSGRPFNWGGGLGFSINTNGQPYILLGLSGMLSSASGRRVALVVGLAGGNEKTLTGTAYQYKVTQTHYDHDNGAIIYGNLRDVPKFYDTGKDLSVDVYDKFKVNWFLGLTFNLGSFGVK